MAIRSLILLCMLFPITGAWLCILTTGAGREGQSGQYVAVTRSKDQGRSWSELIPLEPPDGPEASYAVLLKIPSGSGYKQFFCTLHKYSTTKNTRTAGQAGMVCESNHISGRKQKPAGNREEVLTNIFCWNPFP